MSKEFQKYKTSPADKFSTPHSNKKSSEEPRKRSEAFCKIFNSKIIPSQKKEQAGEVGFKKECGVFYMEMPKNEEKPKETQYVTSHSTENTFPKVVTVTESDCEDFRNHLEEITAYLRNTDPDDQS